MLHFAFITCSMRHLLLVFLCCCSLAHAHAQRPYTPDPKARSIHDKAVNLYLRYNQNKDSVLSAIRLEENALAIDSTYLIAWNSKLSFECQARRYNDALKTIKRMMNIFPGETDLAFFSGILAFRTGNNEEATIIFDQLIKTYNKITDENNNPDHLKTPELNKALALKLLGRNDESRQVLVNLSMKEHDLTVRRHINAYISKSREDIIEEMISAR